MGYRSFSFHNPWVHSISVYYVPGAVVGAGDPEVNKTDKYCPHRPSIVADRPESDALLTTTPGKYRTTLYTPSLKELWGIPK